MGLQNKFAENDAWIQTQQTQCANNNLATFNATVAENNHLQGTSVSISSQSVIKAVATPFPQVSTAAENSVGAALGNIGQGQAAIGQLPGGGDGGGNTLPCVTARTWIAIPDGEKQISEIAIGDKVLAFNADGKRVPEEVIGLHVHLVEEYTIITFEDGRETGLIEDHLYWQRGTSFRPIRDVDSVWHWNGHWESRSILKREVIVGRTLVYNLEVRNLQTYIANGDAVHNLKPRDGDGGGGPV